jgi:glycosyltransferase involved in cell wall biosynthesis
MKILYVSQYYPPEIGAPAARVSELSAHWARAGHDVTVLTGFPNHPTGVVHSDYRSRFRRLVAREKSNGVDVVRTWLWPLPNRKPLERIANYSSFGISAFLRGLFLRKPDVVIGTSPQLLVALSAWAIARFKRRPVIFEVRDIWPDAILASGVGRPSSLLARSLTAISKFLHKHADLVVVVTPAFKRELVDRWGVDANKIQVVQNGVETSLFDSGSIEEADLGLPQEAFVVAYVGTLGLAHGLGTVLDAAEEMKTSDPDVYFVLAGAGAESDLLKDRIDLGGLTNVKLLGELPRAQIPALLKATDVSLVLLKKAEIFETVIPTKMLEFMASGLPIVLGVDGQARELLEAAGAGIHITPQDTGALVEAVRRLKNEPTLRDRFGSDGRRYVEQHLSRESTAELYLDILERLRK